ncbi:hypothetical protein LAZ67_2001760 [Cordylochernes scorpioides]|uniref:Integrase catalytic domain-containing protein n=1 Tax=Cordylochernes scorpioides TaxID=51811 RepID=A0ABY6K2A0_9ARAC|nr:hypothetical protein LAZ67_2001760 [Cordylochernes scorpioides]
MTTELPQIQKFNSDNFHLWKFQMKIILEAKDLLSITDGSEVKPEIEDIAKFSEWKKKDAKSKMLLPDKYKNFITAWDSVSSEEKTLENLTARLLKEESLQDHWDSSGNFKPDNALMTFSKFNRNSTASNKQQQHQQSIKDKKKNTHCGYCKKKGHWWKECYKRKEEQKGQQPSSSARDDSCAFLAETSAFLAETKDSWIADSGATDHITFRREWFSTFEEIPEGVHPVCLGDGKKIYAKGKGNIDILSYVDSQEINAALLDVLYIPELETNLFSISTATNHGIVHELTAPYTPEQNGISERDNRTIVESARCLLHGRKMSLELWAEAVNTAVYLLNRCTKVLGNSTPYEIWYKRKPSILHLKTFGSSYIERTLEHYNLLEIKLQSVPSDPYSKLTKEMCPKDNQEIEEMNKIPYRQTIGSLMYLMTGTRPDIAYAVSRVSQFMNNPGPSHWTAVKKIFGYLKATKNIGICFGGSSYTTSLIGFSDADFAGDLDTRKSTTGYVFMLNNGPISWCSQKQNCVSLSTTESEYIAASKATKEAIWLRQLLRELHQEQVKPTTIFCDNQSCIRLVHNPEYHKRTKHIDISYQFIRDQFQKHAIDLLYVCSNDQAADIFTKALPPERYRRLRSQLGLFETTKCLLGKPYIPQLYNIVLCKVIDISNGTCKCQIIGTENNLYNSPFIGIIRKEFIKKAPNQMDIDISTCFKPGDILLARVLSLGDSSFYILSTLEDNLGVVVAHTEDGKIMSVIDRERMKCPETQEIEPRKVANVMFKRKSQTTSDNQD